LVGEGVLQNKWKICGSVEGAGTSDIAQSAVLGNSTHGHIEQSVQCGAAKIQCCAARYCDARSGGSIVDRAEIVEQAIVSADDVLIDNWGRDNSAIAAVDQVYRDWLGCCRR
jgi:hypothetical protein